MYVASILAFWLLRGLRQLRPLRLACVVMHAFLASAALFAPKSTQGRCVGSVALRRPVQCTKLSYRIPSNPAAVTALTVELLNSTHVMNSLSPSANIKFTRT